MPRELLAALQLGRLKQTVARVSEKVPFYRERLAAAGISADDIETLPYVAKLPFTTKSDLREHYPFGMLAVERTHLARVHASSGTKGKPTIVGYTSNDIRIWQELCARAIMCAGGKPGDLLHNAYGYGLFTGGLGLHYGGEGLGVTVVPVSGGFTERQVTLIRDLQPDGISATPSYMLAIAEKMEQLGLDPRETSLSYGIFGAEPWSDAMRRTIEQKLALKAVDIYGLSEVVGPGVAIECHEAQDGLHIGADHFYAEVVDPETGEVLPEGATGELVFTSLTKEAFPVIRYRTGDIASLTYTPCACGRTTPRMSRVKGRVDDMLIIRGVNVFPAEIEPVLLEHVELAPHYQLHLSKRGALDYCELHVELTAHYYAAHIAGRAKEQGADLRGASEPPYGLRYEYSNSEEIARCDAVHDLRVRLESKLRERLNVAAPIKFFRPGGIARSEGKAVRIVDRRTENAFETVQRDK